MLVKPKLWMSGALLCVCATLSANAQAVYKCVIGKSVTYSERPCAGRIINTEQARMPRARDADAQRRERARVMARAMRPRAGESAQQFETRRRRALLLPADRAECARLDTRMPVEAASLDNPDRREVSKAEDALKES
ncbi:MAG: hypothetical protein NDJ19_02435, partial [Ramlibacter sp.]|nr:hypothetical protein [Ramlibacter sp.]